MPAVLKQTFKPTTKNFRTLNICDLFLYRGNSAYATVENLLYLLCGDKKKVDANSHTLSITQLINAVSKKLFGNPESVALRKELIALFAAYTSEPAQANNSLILELLSACFKELPEGVKIVPAAFTAPNKYFDLAFFTKSRGSKTHTWGEHAKSSGSIVEVKESFLFCIEGDDSVIVDRIQVLVDYEARYSKKKGASCICICNPKVTVRHIGLEDTEPGKKGIPTCVCDLSNVCKKFYVSTLGPIFPKDTGDVFAGAVLELNLNFLEERVFGKFDVSPTYFAIRMFSMLASVASDEISVRSAFTKCTKHETESDTEIVESRFIFAMPNLLYAVCLKYSVVITTIDPEVGTKNEAGTATVRTKECIKTVEIETHKCERLERDIRSWVRFHTCDLPTLVFRKFSLHHTFEVDSKKIVGEHFSSEYEDKLVAPVVESTTGDIDYCKVVHSYDSENPEERLSLCIVEEEARKTVDLLRGRGLGILYEKGINHEALSLLITRSVRNSYTLNRRLADATGLLLLKKAGHCICFSRITRQHEPEGRGVTTTESAKRNYNDIEEHFLYEIKGIESSYVHVCAHYKVGKYHYRYGRYRAYLEDLILYIRVIAGKDLQGKITELPASVSLREFMQYVTSNSDTRVEVDCAEFREAMREIPEVVRDVSDPLVVEVLQSSNAANIVARRSVLPEIDLAELLQDAARGYYMLVVDKSYDGMLKIIGDPVIRYDNPLETELSYLNSLLETNTSRDVCAGHTQTNALRYNFVSYDTAKGTRELVKKRMKVLQRLKDYTSGKLHTSVLEAIANLTSSGESRDFIRHLTHETIRRVGFIDAKSSDACYAVHITGVSLDVSHTLNEDGVGSIDLAQNYALAYGTWWSNNVAHFSISCTIDIYRSTKTIHLKFHNVRIGIMDNHLGSKVLESRHRITNTGSSSLVRVLKTGKNILNASSFSLTFSAHEILDSTKILGYTHVLTPCEEGDLGSDTMYNNKYMPLTENLHSAPNSEDIESQIARLIVEFMRSEKIDGILSSIPPHADSGLGIRYIAPLCRPSYLAAPEDKVEYNIDAPESRFSPHASDIPEVEYAENAGSSKTGATIHSLVSSIRSNEYRKLRAYLGEQLSLHPDLDIEISNSAILDSPESFQYPFYPGITASVDVLSTIRVSFNRQASEFKNMTMNSAAVLLSYTIAEHSILGSSRCSIGNFKLRVPKVSRISQDTGMSASWQDCNVSQELSYACGICSIQDIRGVLVEKKNEGIVWTPTTDTNNDYDDCDVLERYSNNEEESIYENVAKLSTTQRKPLHNEEENIYENVAKLSNAQREPLHDEEENIYENVAKLSNAQRKPLHDGSVCPPDIQDSGMSRNEEKNIYENVAKLSLVDSTPSAAQQFDRNSNVTKAFSSELVATVSKMTPLCSEIFQNSGTYGGKSARAAVHSALKSMACLATEGSIQSNAIKILQHEVTYSIEDGVHGRSINGVHSVLASYGDNASKKPSSANLAMNFSFVLEKDITKNMLSECDEEGVDFYGNRSSKHIYSAYDCVFELTELEKQPLTEEEGCPPREKYTVHVPSTYLGEHYGNWNNIVDQALARKGGIAAKLRVWFYEFCSCVRDIARAVCNAISNILGCFPCYSKASHKVNFRCDATMANKVQSATVANSASHDPAAITSSVSCEGLRAPQNESISSALCSDDIDYSSTSSPGSDIKNMTVQPVYASSEASRART